MTDVRSGSWTLWLRSQRL